MTCMTQIEESNLYYIMIFELEYIGSVMPETPCAENVVSYEEPTYRTKYMQWLHVHEWNDCILQTLCLLRTQVHM